jgi:thiamine biosynthesis lipoprotein
MPSAKLKKPPKASLPALEWSFTGIGTQWWIGFYEHISVEQARLLRRLVDRRIELFDQTWSRFRADSLVSQIASAAGSYDLPSEGVTLLQFYRQLYELSSGAVTPLIGQLLSVAGYDASYRLTPAATLASVPAWDDVMTLSGSILTTTLPVLLDFGAAGKGYLVDLVSAILLENGVERFCVDAGGDMYVHGLRQELVVGLEDPRNTAQVIGVARLRDTALCGSAGNRRRWDSYHHIMDPRTQKSVSAVQAVWVCADSALVADGLTTALWFMPAEKLLGQFRCSYVLVAADNTVIRSADFPGELFVSGAKA